MPRRRPAAGARSPARLAVRGPLRVAAGVVLAALLTGLTLAALALPAGTKVGSLMADAQSPSGNPPGISAATAQLLSLGPLPAPGRAAPDFSLTDQSGHPLSLSQFRGDSVVLSFNDDECTDLCTLLAEDIVRANRDLGPAAGHVVWLAVNANPFYPAVDAVQAWTDEHGLGDQPNWYFGTAQPSVLASIWRTYGIDVQLDDQTRTVVHGTEMFFIDPSGRERAIAEFGTASADTDLFGHAIAQMADDLLPAGERASHVGGPSAAAPSETNAAVGATAPGFSLPYLAGGRGTFHLSDLRGHYAVLSFWSSTCTACRSDLSNIEAAYRQVAPHLSFVGIDVADQQGPARTLAAETGLTYPLVSDQSGSAAASEKITGLPYTVVLDKSGQVLIRHPGLMTTEQLVYLLESDVPVLSQMGS